MGGAPKLGERTAGVLLHLTSLPGPHGCGDLGPEARRFADRLEQAGQRWWQVLPVGPLGPGHSPYVSSSAFAGNPLLISLDDLTADGLLDTSDLGPPLPEGRVDYTASAQRHETVLREAYARFQKAARDPLRREAEDFRKRSHFWLEDYVLFSALRQRHHLKAWVEWDRPFARHDAEAVEKAKRDLLEDMEYERFVQFVFFRQWSALRGYCAARGIGLIGDIPIFVAHDSADVWANTHMFKLDENGRPVVVAGVPPDYFSASGQVWGNPVYRWDLLKTHGYTWWMERIRHAAALFDAVRLDHFIGFHRHWEIPAGSATAKDGRYEPGPGKDLFETVFAKLGRLPFIAEDLGVVTPEVTRLRRDLGLPGMRVLQFCFGTSAESEKDRPHSFEPNTVVYPGTHDNDTTLGWFHGLSIKTTEGRREHELVLRYLNCPPEEVHWAMIRMACLSVSHTAIVPLQDVLGLGSEARMNKPATPTGNWTWRLLPDLPVDAALARLGELTRTYGRAAAASG